VKKRTVKIVKNAVYNKPKDKPMLQTNTLPNFHHICTTGITARKFPHCSRAFFRTVNSQVGLSHISLQDVQACHLPYTQAMKLLVMAVLLCTSLGFSSRGSLTTILENIQRQTGAPALAAAVLQNGALLEAAAVGERALGAGVKVQPDDAFHIGSLSKSVTATMLAKLVEDGVLRFDSTLEQLFASANIHPSLRRVTLEQLLSHTAGFAANLPDERLYDWALEPSTARTLYLEQALASAPEYTPGRVVGYSNTGYVLAALAAEKATGQSWEALVRRFVLEPLEMKSCAFGTRFANLSAPHGHEETLRGLRSVSPEQPNGNSAVLYGADGLRCSVVDFAKYTLAHLNGERGVDGIVSSQSFVFLHRARQNAGQDIRTALGWFVFPNGALWHNGSNTLNYSEVIINARSNVAMVVLTNAPTEFGAKVAEQTFDALVAWFK
jgi:CubicO group peptidase (beta-lactamase class C family)